MIKNKKMDARQYPRAGKVKIGIKATSQSGKEIPKSVDYFVPTGRYAAMFTKAFGEKPKEIEIVFPPAPNGDIDQIINHFYRSYKGSQIFCIGDGETANRSDGKGNMVPRKCPCELLDNEKKSCSERLKIVFMIPKIPIVGVWEFSTGGSHSRINAFSGIDITRAFAGNVAGIPMTLRVEYQKGAVSGSQNKFPVITLTPNASTEQLLKLSGADINTRLNVMMFGQEMPEIEQKEKTKEIAAPEETTEKLSEEPEPEDVSITDISDGDLNTALNNAMNDKSPMTRRALKLEHLGVESISECDDKQKKVEFLKFLQK